MRLRLSAVLLAGSFLAAAPAQAQTHFTYVSGGTLTAFGVNISPYSATMGTGASATPVQLYCVDYFHNAITGSAGWNANLTNLATVGTTSTVTRFGTISLYKQAAYLVNQMATANNGDKAMIQATIWNMFGSAEGYGLAISTTSQSSYLSSYNAANNPDAHTVDWWWNETLTKSSTMSMNGWYVVSDVNKGTGSGQEFLMYNAGGSSNGTTTPEPASFVLFGTGLAGLGLFRRYRRKQDAA